MNGRRNRSTRRKPAPTPLCPPQIPLDQTRDWTRAAAVGSQRLTASAMARPISQTLQDFKKISSIRCFSSSTCNKWCLLTYILVHITALPHVSMHPFVRIYSYFHPAFPTPYFILICTTDSFSAHMSDHLRIIGQHWEVCFERYLHSHGSGETPSVPATARLFRPQHNNGRFLTYTFQFIIHQSCYRSAWLGYIPTYLQSSILVVSLLYLTQILYFALTSGSALWRVCSRQELRSQRNSRCYIMLSRNNRGTVSWDKTWRVQT
jgi:hypothetical protein